MAQRESYQLPEHRTSIPSSQSQTRTQSQSQAQGQGTSYQYSQNASTLITSPPLADGPKITYRCGECGLPVQLVKGDSIRCTHCGHRVLYKERTGRMVQYEAR